MTSEKNNFVVQCPGRKEENGRWWAGPGKNFFFKRQIFSFLFDQKVVVVVAVVLVVVA
jgi:hypothetical protein